MIRRVRGNVPWFIASLALAFMVWVIATLQVDPIRVTVFNNVPIQMIENDAMIITNRSSLRRMVAVEVRARQSTIERMTPEDLTVRADLSNLNAGTHAVPLTVSTARQATVDTRPAQLTVTLEQRQARQKPVVVEFTGEPPPGYQRGEPQLGQTQVLVTGTLAQVDRVDHIRATVDLSDQRTAFSRQVDIVAVNANGTILSDVTLGTDTVEVSIDIRQREDVVALPIRPQIDFESLAEGYVVRLEMYTPQTATVRGSAAALALLPDVLDTAIIDLTNRTESFTINVPVQLPDMLANGEVTLLEGQNVTVDIVIETRVAQAQLDDIEITVTGAVSPVRVIPSLVTVLVTGPQPFIDALTADMIVVSVDVTQLAPGTYDLQPVVTISSGANQPDEIRVIPSTVGVIISATEP
ncbi:MAG: hypothetical protein IT298_01415 [Chloroflexi bacterium]|jgi:YbbR domain-containing protein|nr:MAG: YbbR family protein [Chloroflexi bacterium OLB13]MBC6955537.1 hypothetical protein [Chloroflexota bacterium]MBV6437855.1 CdaA regulatory protein CdaR [Anaerolineae bacterium]MDL1915538.1 hypothetical protein [Anaerolineae bacterium CFX4]OQY82315.1 MAG: hypothetical protein B6D42_09660 [Anaerolineae bacterium UTCFX5]